MKDLLNEMDRMKGLFGYKRGVVISEQPDEKFDTRANKEITREINKTPKPVQSPKPAQLPQNALAQNKPVDFSKFPCLNSFKTEKKQTSKLGKDIIEELKIGTGNLKQYMFGADGTLYSNGAEYGTWKCGANGNTININGKDITVGGGQTNTESQTKKSTGQKNIFDIVQSEKNPTTGKNYVWKEVRHAYQLEKQPSTPEGSIQTNTQLQKDWLAGWRPGQQKKTTTDVKPAEKIPLVPTNQTSNQPADDEDVATPQIQVPQQVTNYMAQQQKVIANVDPNDYYKTLYNAGLIQGEGGNRVRYRGPELSKDQQDKLTQAMTNLGYEFYRKGNDKRLVYRKK
jgi:hypothetical protein